MRKIITVGDKAVEFKSSAAIPRIYRKEYGRDIFKDMAALSRAMDENKEQASEIALESLEMFENLAWIMAKHADPQLPDVDEWLDGFETFSIYQILPELLEMWSIETKSIEESKKKLMAAAV